MKYRVLISALSAFGLIAQPTHEEVKKKWLHWASQKVEEETARFLSSYDLTPEDLPEEQKQLFIQTVSREYDKQLEHQIRCLELGIRPNDFLSTLIKYDYFNVLLKLKKSGVLKIGDTITDEQKEPVVRKVRNVFKDFKSVIVLHDKDLDDNMCVCMHHAGQSPYIIMNILKHQNDFLEDELRHELAHILYNDAQEQDFIMYCAWASSEEDREHVEQKALAMQRAREMRADVFAAVYASDYGRKLIANHRKGYLISGKGSHPRNKDRAAVLNQVASELEQAV